MAEQPSVAFSAHRGSEGEMWVAARVAAGRVALFRRWARHLRVTEADLAALIFQLGTVELALETCNGSTDMAEREVGTVADYMLDRLERLSQTWAEQKEGEDSGTHLAR